MCFHYSDRSLEIKGSMLFTYENNSRFTVYKDFSFSHQSEMQLTHAGILLLNKHL